MSEVIIVIIVVVVVIVVAAIVSVMAWRSLTLFELSIQDGKITIVRGAIPPALFDEIRDIVRIGRVEHGTIRVVKDRGDAKLVCSPEMDDATVQRIRNVLGRFPAATLRTAGRRR